MTAQSRILSALLGVTLLGTALTLPMEPVQAKKAAQETEQAPAKTPDEASEPAQEKPAKKHDLLKLQPVLDEQTKQALEETGRKLDAETRTSLNKLFDAIHLEDRTVYNEMRDAEELSIADIGMLWEAAVTRSGTIRYAIEKLSRRDATGKPVEGDSFSKRILQNMVHLGGVAGSMWTQNPAGVIGSGMVQDLMRGNPQDSALSRVTDADMVLLAKQVEELQSQLIQLYYGYQHAKERLQMAQEASSTINKYYDHAASTPMLSNESLQPLMQSIYDSAKQDEQSAQQAFNSARNALGLMVGPDAVAALEQPQSTSKATVE